MTIENPVPQPNQEANDYILSLDPERQAEIRLYREQNFLPHIYRRPEAIDAVDSLIEREDFTPEGVFRALSAACDTFHREDSDINNIQDIQAGLMTKEEADADYVEDQEAQGIEVEFYGWEGRLSEQEYGFFRTTPMQNYREVPFEDQPRIEEIYILKTMEGTIGYDDFIEYMVLKRSKEGKVAVFKRVEQGDQFNPNNEVDEQEISMSPIECKMIIATVKDYLDKSPFGTAGVEPPDNY